MDAIDREIIGELRVNARLPFSALGAAVGLSANAAADRVRRLVADGAIRAFTVVVDPAVEGRGLEALVDVRLGSTDSDAFAAGVMRLPEGREALHVTGASDYVLRVACDGPAGLDDLLRRLRRDLGAVGTDTRIVLRSSAPV